MTLDRENIQFIDTYLKNSDVIFVDIRAELTDHIATAVEEKMHLENSSFYDAFKSYMAINKKQLLKSSNSIWKPSLQDSRMFLTTLHRPYNIAFAILIIFGFWYLQNFFTSEQILEASQKIIFITFIIIIAIQSLVIYAITKERYFYLEKNAVSLMVIYYANLFLNGFWEIAASMGCISIGAILFLLFAYLVHYFKTIKRFKTQFQSL